jgi:hypothetical protein
MPRNVTRDQFDAAVEALWSEIEYQNALPRRTEDEATEIPSFCTMLRQYTQRCEVAWMDQPGTEQHDGRVQVSDALHGLRKIAAIAVRGMIYNGIRARQP